MTTMAFKIREDQDILNFPDENSNEEKCWNYFLDLQSIDKNKIKTIRFVKGINGESFYNWSCEKL